MAIVAGATVTATMDLPIGNDLGPDPRPDLDKDKVIHPCPSAMMFTSLLTTTKAERNVFLKKSRRELFFVLVAELGDKIFTIDSKDIFGDKGVVG